MESLLWRVEVGALVAGAGECAPWVCGCGGRASCGCVYAVVAIAAAVAALLLQILLLRVLACVARGITTPNRCSPPLSVVPLSRFSLSLSLSQFYAGKDVDRVLGSIAKEQDSLLASNERIIVRCAKSCYISI